MARQYSAYSRILQRCVCLVHLSMMEWTVLRRADHPSLWKQTMTEVVGSEDTGRFLSWGRAECRAVRTACRAARTTCASIWLPGLDVGLLGLYVHGAARTVCWAARTGCRSAGTVCRAERTACMAARTTCASTWLLTAYGAARTGCTWGCKDCLLGC